MSSELSILLISVGNSRTAIGTGAGSRLERVDRCPNSDLDAILELLRTALGEDSDQRHILVASVNRGVSAPLVKRIKAEFEARVLMLGADLPIPIGTCLDPEAKTGQDRLLNAAAAFDRFRQACVVVDAGTAVTVDFVDGEGTFHGGAIAPGAQMQLNALHAGTDALPQVSIAAPLPEAFGANTAQAMLHGVYFGIRGMVRHLIERYAEAYQAYPAIIATGGDAHLLFDEDELIEHVVDDLPLHGMLTAFRAAQSVAPDGRF